MHFFSLNLQRAGAINQAIYGNFSAAKAQEVVVARGSTLELLRPDEATGKLVSVASVNTFSVLRSLAPFRLHGAPRDYIVVGSDSGKLTILEFEPTAVAAAAGGSASGAAAGGATTSGSGAASGAFRVVKSETFGKTGCRRAVPGQYLACDPKGRAVMVAAVEKQKLVYVMNRDASNRLTVSSPLECHRANTVTYCVVGVDVHFENPVFAALELDYGDADLDPSGEAAEEAEKHLTYYELDLGLNHVVRKWSEAVSRTASMLLAVPGGTDGPSGVLIVGENWVAYKHEGHDEVRTALPRREGYPSSRGLLVTACATHKQRDLFFFLLQTEAGDLYKCTLDYEGDVVRDVIVSVFDTVAPANALCITRSGLLFCASEFGDHALFQFSGIGDGEGVCTSRKCDDPELGDDGASAAAVAPTFAPPPLLLTGGGGGNGNGSGAAASGGASEAGKLNNLAVVDVLESAAPITDALVADVCGEGSPQILACCGRGARSSLRILRHGVKVQELAVSELPGFPSAVWTLKSRLDDGPDKYIVVSFTNATLVLAVGETVEEVTDSGLFARAPTLTVQLLADGSMLQVYPNAVRHVRAGGRSAEWKPPGKKVIEKASANARQVAVSLGGGELVYFELDVAGNLMEMGTKDLGADVACLDVGPLPSGRARSPFLAVGTLDNGVRLLTLDGASGAGPVLSQVGSMQCPARPESLALLEMASDAAAAVTAGAAGGAAGGGASAAGGAGPVLGLYLNVGLTNGVMQRAAVDATSGALSDTRTRFLGARPVRLFRVVVQGVPALLALSSRGWLAYVLQGRYYMTPLSYDALEHAAPFASEQCPEGLVAIAHNTLRIVTVDKLGALFNASVVPLRYTPRKLCAMASPLAAAAPPMPQGATSQSLLLLIESDHNEYNEAEKAALLKGLPLPGSPEAAAAAAEAADAAAGAAGSAGGMEVDGAPPPPPPPLPPPPAGMETGGDAGADDDEEEEEDSSAVMGVKGPLPPAEGKWASCVRLLDAASEETLELVELDNGEAALSLCTCVFHSRGGEAFVVVGTARHLRLHPRAHEGCFVRVYRLLDQRLQLLHSTEIDDVPLALCEFQGRLLVGSGKALRIYDLGKKKLLRKAENKSFPSAITGIKATGDRIYVSDMTESLLFVKYRRNDNALVVYADDTAPRFTSSFCCLDYDTVCGGDKFGNAFVLRLPAAVSDEVDNPTGSKLLWDSGLLNGAAHKLELHAQCHVGEVITAMHRTALVPGGAEAVVYVTTMGSVGALLPSATKEDRDFFAHLEMHMRQEWQPVTGRDHMAYRSYFGPVKEVADGELCELFAALPFETQKTIAADLDRSPGEVLKKLEDTRNRLL